MFKISLVAREAIFLIFGLERSGLQQATLTTSSRQPAIPSVFNTGQMENQNIGGCGSKASKPLSH